MVGSSVVKRWSYDHRGLAVLPLVVAYLALSVLATRAGIQAMTTVLEPVERASSDAPRELDAVPSLEGDELPRELP